ncbi:hypothetical protein [Mycolicibacterium sphagni]|uniref:Uncharacterized protein n=1 Tax=Mycolicibacterium sphagni TaxID=1786 RepID=A0A255DMX5_9MYCO|nr:hypothetical protein [Mycolicibacterium sphagni]OYN80440.1 hypothetical protein CG716_09965 [Mycolicibacterium sphagni]
MKFTPQPTTTDAALAIFDAFVREWLPPGLQDMMFGHEHNAAEVVRNAIRGTVLQHALALEDGPFGYAVFSGRPCPIKERKSGWTYEPVSPVFDVQPINALKYVLRRQKANDETDVIYFIGEITRLKHEERR